MARFTQAELQNYLARFAEKSTGIDGVCIESDLHDSILADCRKRGWIALHGRMDFSTGRTIGEPDFTIIADCGRTFYIECKSKTGKVSKEQMALHAWASKLGHTVHVVRNMEEYFKVIQ
jgi:hypothetical protein